MNKKENSQEEFDLLRQIKKKPKSSQRELAKDLGFSLGKLNAVATAAKRKDELRIQFPIGSGKIAAYTIIEGKVAEIDVYGINPLGGEKFIRLQ